mmetsp:Transcript_65812/g.122754  ORF Transcript_65812/g.122754 Transcript_65812/m.122754 type:complete len:208 (-) Transcript_65812:57-680(-)
MVCQTTLLANGSHARRRPGRALPRWPYADSRRLIWQMRLLPTLALIWRTWSLLPRTLLVPRAHPRTTSRKWRTTSGRLAVARSHPKLFGSARKTSAPAHRALWQESLLLAWATPLLVQLLRAPRPRALNWLAEFCGFWATGAAVGSMLLTDASGYPPSVQCQKHRSSGHRLFKKLCLLWICSSMLMAVNCASKSEFVQAALRMPLLL